MGPLDLLAVVGMGALLGVAYAIAGIILKREEGEAIKPRKAARSIVLFGAAGIVIAASGGTVTRAAIQANLDQVVIVGIAFDWLWARARRAGYLDWIDDIPIVGAPPGR